MYALVDSESRSLDLLPIVSSLASLKSFARHLIHVLTVAELKGTGDCMKISGESQVSWMSLQRSSGRSMEQLGTL